MKKVVKALVYGGGAICGGVAILLAGFGGTAWTLASLLHNEQITSSNVGSEKSNIGGVDTQ